ncbi:flotillin 2-PF [Capsaspora owczarzaki ATCC 30864]|uniref:Flotillin 2-PF n=1 Tax=Capsaspora owczarzaki (strain ATCC 30864) TaxID=595528 RepID=A0A0D2VZM8_CAPO3|nr:flotillin 2-PF [Capsaspora owczarzaki ATCC 30864]KJE97317.1 flotillin 2-PF [Capsaspora owczarzaki ATCC 30864]|eukprot:XP_004343619.1 flotillin 2-PF [Capsaspora owczarzaki ATCC 30864]
MGNVHTVGPNEALVISGGCSSGARKVIIGGYGFAWWLVSDIKRLTLEVLTLEPVCNDVETKQGVAVSVSAVAQVKFLTERALLEKAMEQFLGKSTREIQDVIVQTLEGHLRAILGTLTVEEIYKDREKFAELVREVASPDVGKMGVEILSFTIKDIADKVGYLDSLGKKRTAEVKRDADIGVAHAKRDAGIKEAEAQRRHMDVKYAADTEIADAKRGYELQKAQFDQEINTKKATAELAYSLQAAKVQQSIKQENIQIEVIERRKQIEVEEQEIIRRQYELEAQVRKPADADKFKIETLAQAQRTRTIVSAQAEAEAIKLIGAAEAAAIQAKGIAEADEMRMKAAAFKQYGNAAIMNMVLEALPKIAAEIAAPLAKTDNIVLLSGDSNATSADRATSEIARLVGQLPPAVQAITGVDLTKTLARLASGSATAPAATATR